MLINSIKGLRKYNSALIPAVHFNITATFKFSGERYFAEITNKYKLIRQLTL